MNKLKLSFLIKEKTIDYFKKKPSIGNLPWGIVGNGVMADISLIFSESSDQNITFEDGVLEYLSFMCSVADSFAKGNLSSFSVSTMDWFSNSFKYEYNGKDKVEIIGDTTCSVHAVVDYENFKNEINYKSLFVIEYLLDAIPGLRYNKDLRKKFPFEWANKIKWK